jgi:hypothetical protein
VGRDLHVLEYLVLQGWCLGPAITPLLGSYLPCLTRIARLSALKCGHLFGLTCLERMFQVKQDRCPLCQLPARKADIRPIFAPKVALRCCRCFAVEGDE